MNKFQIVTIPTSTNSRDSAVEIINVTKWEKVCDCPSLHLASLVVEALDIAKKDKTWSKLIDL